MYVIKYQKLHISRSFWDDNDRAFCMVPHLLDFNRLFAVSLERMPQLKRIEVMIQMPAVGLEYSRIQMLYDWENESLAVVSSDALIFYL